MKTAIQNPSSFRMFLQNELVARCKRNPGYSLRAFAKTLQLSSSALSAMLNGKRPITEGMKLRLGLALGLDPKEISKLRSQPDRRTKKKIDQVPGSVEIQQLTLDTFAIISDWYHYAILELTKVKDFQPDKAWISKALGITRSEANIAIERLVRVGLLDTDLPQWKDLSENGNVTNIDPQLTSAGSKQLQRQILEKSIEALQTLPLEKRNHTSITVAINPKDIPLAKEKIKTFRRELAEFFEGNPDLQEVYHLSLSLYPVTNIGGTK